MMLKVLFGLALVICFLEKCLAIKCMECVDTPNPSYCDKVATCSANSSCLLRHYITTSLAVFYSSGCVSNKVCNEMARQANIPQNEMEDSPLDMTVCTQCCHDNDFCNLEGCGKKATPLSQRGPYCYTCSVQDERFGCRNIKQCASDESCYLDSGNFPSTYKSGCMKQTSCPTSSVSAQHRRWLNVHLPFCCTSDFCNDIMAFVDLTPQPVDGRWSSWNQWSTCSQTCGSGSVRTRKRLCDNPAPQYNGTTCQGVDREDKACHLKHCQGWSSWSSWGACVGPCGTNKQYRFRDCSIGSTCSGDAHQSQKCTNLYSCSDYRCKTSEGFEVVMAGSKRLCLYLSKGAYQWPHANDRCKHMGGDGLVSIANKDVDNAVRTFLIGRLVPCHNCHDESHSYTWFGLYDSTDSNGHLGHFWLNPNITFNYHNFHLHHEPRQHHCGVGGGELYEKWYDVNCREYYSYLCEVIL